MPLSSGTHQRRGSFSLSTKTKFGMSKKAGNHQNQNETSTPKHRRHNSHSHRSHANEANKQITMLHVLRDRLGFESFVQHCLRELSVENILFLLEIAQFKETLLRHNVPETYISDDNEMESPKLSLFISVHPFFFVFFFFVFFCFFQFFEWSRSSVCF